MRLQIICLSLLDFLLQVMARSTELPLGMETVKASYCGTFSAKGLIDWWLSTSLGRKVYQYTFGLQCVNYASHEVPSGHSGLISQVLWTSCKNDSLLYASLYVNFMYNRKRSLENSDPTQYRSYRHSFVVTFTSI